MEDLIRKLLLKLGEDPGREGLLKTPQRVEESLKFLTSGYASDPYKLLTDSVYTDEAKGQMVLLKDIPVYSVCEHHLLPFFGKAHVAYLPGQKIVGISKITQLVDVFARRLQVQERLTNQIAETLMEALTPQGVGCVIEANHLCLEMRGEQKRESSIVTSKMLGEFKENPALKSEFLALVNSNKSIS